MPSDNPSHGVSLVTGYEDIIPDLLRRLILVILLISFVVLVLWLDRGGLEDSRHPERHPTFVDVFYYTLVTITTVGYGDIVPVTQRARLISTLIVTPVRIAVLLIFIGTAYQLVIQRYREAYQMGRVKKRLKDHIIICGYGVKGHATIAQLLSFGRKPEEIVVIDVKQDAAQDAASDGFTAFRGNATSEAALKAAGIETAEAIVVDADRDDTTVLICLTAKHINPKVCVVAAAREAENVPLIYRSGANIVVAPPVAGGRMLAIATELAHAPKFLDDIITFGMGLDFGEREIKQSEAGLTFDQIPDLNTKDKLIIGAYHKGRRYTFADLAGLQFDPGDAVIYLVAKSGSD